ncbi:MAG TPA: aldo/keto reductase [Steroidobacteraceae bacterium]|jgi:aryl-alcohol dehydrogenase-like predicted oxidoreductase
MNANLNAAAAGQVALGADLKVNRLGFGAMRITGRGVWGDPPDVATAVRVLQRAAHLGVTFIDTADSYGPEVSENLIARALYPYAADMVIATKGGLVRPAPAAWDRDARPEHLRRACEASLTRLRRDRIDLYQLHAPDPRVPLEDSMGELVRLKSEGKIRHIGVSNVSAAELERCERLTPIVSVQNRYNLEDRESEDVLAYCARKAIAFLPWAPLASGRHARGGGALRTLERVAERHGITVGQAAIAWLLGRSSVMLPIPGTGSIEHLEQNIAAAAVSLTAGDLHELG